MELLVLFCCILAEIIIVLFSRKSNKKKKVIVKKELYKLMEERVLDMALKYRMTYNEAASYECQIPFLLVEFLNTRPLTEYLYGLDEWITVGRSRENKICIQDDYLSRMHCKIGFINGQLVVQDQGSKNGTIVKNRFWEKTAVYGGEPVAVRSGGRVILGDYKMKVHVVYGWEAIK